MHQLLTGLLCLALFAPAPGDEIKEDAVVKAKAEEALTLLLKGDYKNFAELTYPPVVKEMGGREMMAETLAAKMKQLKELGYEVRTLKASDPTTSATAGDERYVVVPYRLDLKAPGGNLTAPSYLLAISSYQSRTWTFVDGAGLLDAETQKKMLPNLPPGLRLPKPEKPVFVQEGPQKPS
jgi:hypothetical protein